MTARLKIDLDALKSNYKMLSQSVAGEVAAVVKANAYGLGMAPVSQALSQCGCSSFFVASAHEGVELRKLLPGTTIYVFEGVLPATLSELLASDLVPVIYSQQQLKLWHQHRERAIAIQVDTGMNRLGFTIDTDPGIFAKFSLCLLVSHFANADTPDNALNQMQRDKFHQFHRKFAAVPTSLANSAASVALEASYHGDLVRPGIGIFGGSPGAFNHDYKNVVTLEAQVIDIRQVGKGAGIGYGSSFICAEETKVAAIGIGYADGIRRALSNRGQISLLNKRADIVGRISMDITQIAVDHLEVEVGDWVQFFGSEIALKEVADQAGTIDYEILTGIGPRVRRVYERC